MASSDNRLSDSLTVEVNGGADRVPDRPGDSAQKAKWVDYVVALGASRDAAGEQTRSELIDLADRLEP